MTMTYDEAAAYLRISRRTLERMVAMREIAYVLTGRRAKRFRQVDLDEYQERQRVPSVAEVRQRVIDRYTPGAALPPVPAGYWKHRPGVRAD